MLFVLIGKTRRSVVETLTVSGCPAGSLVLCNNGALSGGNARLNVDKAFVLLFEVMDENESWYLDENIQLFGNSGSKDAPDFGESNLMHGEVN